MSSRVRAVLVKNPDSAVEYKVLEQVAMSASAANRTYVVELHRSFDKVVGVLRLTAQSAATAITVTPTVSYDGDNYVPVPIFATAAGVATMSDLSWSKTVAAADQLVCPLDVDGVDKLKLVVDSTGGGASDLFDLAIVVVGRN